MILSTVAVLGVMLLNPFASGAPRTTPPAAAPIAGMSVEIWPEYDDPRVLVIYSGQVDPSVNLPTDFSLAIPQGAQINMAGGIEPGGAHVHAEYQTRERGDGLLDLSYKLETREFYMEFYYDPLSGSDDRSFTYAVVAPASVAKLAVKVQHPRRADNFTMSPPAQQLVQGGDGFPYSVIERDGVAAGAVLPVLVSYHKTDRQPSVQPQPAQMQAAPSPPGQPMAGWRMFTIGLLAGVAACAVFHILRPGEREGDDEDDETAPASRRLHVVESGGGPAYCTQCGEAMAAGDRYCARCGKRRSRKASAS